MPQDLPQPSATAAVRAAMNPSAASITAPAGTRPAGTVFAGSGAGQVRTPLTVGQAIPLLEQAGETLRHLQRMDSTGWHLPMLIPPGSDAAAGRASMDAWNMKVRLTTLPTGAHLSSESINDVNYVLAVAHDIEALSTRNGAIMGGALVLGIFGIVYGVKKKKPAVSIGSGVALIGSSVTSVQYLRGQWLRGL